MNVSSEIRNEFSKIMDMDTISAVYRADSDPSGRSGPPNLSLTRQSKQCGFSIYTFDNLKSKSMVRLVRAEKKVLFDLVFARKIARMILIQNI